MDHCAVPLMFLPSAATLRNAIAFKQQRNGHTESTTTEPELRKNGNVMMETTF